MNSSDFRLSTAVVRLAPDMKLLGRQISARRKKLMITQKDLAEMAGVSSRMVSMVERGLANPSVKELSDMVKPIGFVITLQERVINP